MPYHQWLSALQNHQKPQRALADVDCASPPVQMPPPDFRAGSGSTHGCQPYRRLSKPQQATVQDGRVLNSPNISRSETVAAPSDSYQSGLPTPGKEASFAVEMPKNVSRRSDNLHSYNQPNQSQGCGRKRSAAGNTKSPVQSRGRQQNQLPSLAATHPAMYGQAASQSMLPSPPYSPKSLDPNTSPKSMKPLPTRAPTSNATVLSPVSTDSMFQTSSEPQFWSVNCTVLRSDTNAKHGNVVSPVPMIGLPFGSMTEMTIPYPRSQRQKRED